jgi:hypothetical protein
MTSTDHARELALALPEAVEQDHHGRPSFRVAGKIFATLWDERHMNVMLDEPGVLTAVENMPGVCSEVHWGERLAAARVELDLIEPHQLAELLADAWEGKAPVRLTASADPLQRVQVEGSTASALGGRPRSASARSRSK